jgi:2-hydroxychromene-2-carboxylate isomerase
VQSAWKANYETARGAGVFGLPTFRYDGELYWGQDSLPFLERHMKGEKLIA